VKSRLRMRSSRVSRLVVAEGLSTSSAKASDGFMLTGDGRRLISRGTMALTWCSWPRRPNSLARVNLRGGPLMTLLLLITQLLPAIVIATRLFVVFSRIRLHELLRRAHPRGYHHHPYPSP
jgi:hypothetical protein